MTTETTAPGWYHAQGDPPNTHRYWNGSAWSDSPVPVHSTGFPMAPPELDGAAETDRKPWEWWWHVVAHNYANFSGRATRAEFWWFGCFNLLAMAALFVPLFALGSTSESGLGGAQTVFLIAIVVFALLLAIPNLAVTVRRLHDTDRSGWWYLLTVIPIVSYVGSIVLLVFTLLDGTPRQNRYGPDPKRRG